MNIRAIKNRVVVEPIEVTKSAGGLLIPETFTEAPMVGKVIAAGPGITRKGKFHAAEVQIGEFVIYPRNAGEKLKVDDRNVVVLTNDDIMGVVEQDA